MCLRNLLEGCEATEAMLIKFLIAAVVGTFALVAGAAVGGTVGSLIAILAFVGLMLFFFGAILAAPFMFLWRLVVMGTQSLTRVVVEEKNQVS